MNKEEYMAYIDTCTDEMAGYITFSVGCSAGCEECGEDDGCQEFSWASCDLCGSGLAGSRAPAHGTLRSGREEDGIWTVIHYDICHDCVFFVTYGELDDDTMLRMEGEPLGGEER